MPTPSLRKQVVQTANDRRNEGNHTNTRHASFCQIYIATGLGYAFIGGAETFAWRETNGTHKVPQIGNDRTENVRGMRFVSGNLSRFQIRGRDLRQMYQSLYTSKDRFPQDVDFSQMPTTWLVHHIFQSVTGGTTFEDAWWVCHNVIIPDYEFSIPNANDILRESVSFIADGVESWTSNSPRISFNPVVMATATTLAESAPGVISQ